MSKIELKQWNKYFTAAINGLSADQGLSAEITVKVAEKIADLAVDTWNKKQEDIRKDR